MDSSLALFYHYQSLANDCRRCIESIVELVGNRNRKETDSGEACYGLLQKLMFIRRKINECVAELSYCASFLNDSAVNGNNVHELVQAIRKQTSLENIIFNRLRFGSPQFEFDYNTFVTLLALFVHKPYIPKSYIEAVVPSD